MRSDRFECVRKHSDTFGKFRKNRSKNHRRRLFSDLGRSRASASPFAGAFVCRKALKSNTVSEKMAIRKDVNVHSAALFGRLAALFGRSAALFGRAAALCGRSAVLCGRSATLFGGWAVRPHCAAVRPHCAAVRPHSSAIRRTVRPND